MKRWFLFLGALCLAPMPLFAWANGELLLWMDADRGRALEPIAQKFEHDFGLKVSIESPEKLTDSFPLAAQAAKGPDVVVWAHDKLGEWADGGLIAPIEVSDAFAKRLFPKARQAVLHHHRAWGYPLAMETVTLIYNRTLLDGPAPSGLSQLASINQAMAAKHTGVTTTLWDYNSPYYWRDGRRRRALVATEGGGGPR
jgi:maltose/maltodextrin transport system substrate-binding protein